MTRYAKHQVYEVCYVRKPLSVVHSPYEGEEVFEPPHPHEGDLWGSYGLEHKHKHTHHHHL